MGEADLHGQCRTEGRTRDGAELLKDVTVILGWLLQGDRVCQPGSRGTGCRQFVFSELLLTPDGMSRHPYQKATGSQGKRTLRVCLRVPRRSPERDLCPEPGVFSQAPLGHCVQAGQRKRGEALRKTQPT